MSTSTATLTAKQWKSFCKVLGGLARTCNDADIHEGIIRQRSSDSAAIFESDLRPFVGGATLTIKNLKEKLKTLKMFKNGVTITLGQNDAVVSDGVSSYTIVHPDRNYLDNKFMSQAEMESVFPLNFQEASILVRNRIDKILRKRIRIALSKLHANTYKVVFGRHSAFLRVKQQMGASKGPSTSVDLIRGIPLFHPITGYARWPPLPFMTFDFEGDVVWELNRVDKILFSKIYGRIGEAKTKTYTRAELKDD